MRIDQRNNGATGTAGGYTIDRWAIAISQLGKGTWGRNLSGSGGAIGLPYSLGFTSASAYASIAADNFSFYQVIEADNISDFCWGTLNAQPVTLSFWVYSNQTGTFSGTIRNMPSPPTRSYPFTFNIPTASTWTKVVITIPGDTAGTWVMSGNAGALQVVFDLGCGSSNRGPAGVWASANYVGAIGGQSIVATNAANIYFSGVKLEVGSVATLFNRQTLCQEYGGLPEVFSGHTWHYGASAHRINCLRVAVRPAILAHYVDTPMRASPTINVSGNFLELRSLLDHHLYGGFNTMLLQVGPPAVGW